MPYIQVYEKMLIFYKKKITVIKQKTIPVAKKGHDYKPYNCLATESS